MSDTPTAMPFPENTNSLIIFPFSNGAQWPIDETSDEAHRAICNAISDKMPCVSLTMNGHTLSIGMGLIAPDGEHSTVIVSPVIHKPSVRIHREMPPENLMQIHNSR